MGAPLRKIIMILLILSVGFAILLLVKNSISSFISSNEKAAETKVATENNGEEIAEGGFISQIGFFDVRDKIVDEGAGSIIKSFIRKDLNAPGIDRSSYRLIRDVFGNRNSISYNGLAVDDNGYPLEAVEKGDVIHTIVGTLNDTKSVEFIQEAVSQFKPSPFAGDVVFIDRIDSIINSNKEDIGKEYFVLLFSNDLFIPINITGWKVLDREDGLIYKLPSVYENIEKREGRINANVKAGNYVIVASSLSPIGGSFRVNRCSGYHEGLKDFYPSIKLNCPFAIDDFEKYGDKIPYDDDVCFEEARSVRICQTPKTIPKKISYQCKNFLKRDLTAEGCVRNHKNDNDFYLPEWRLFLNQNKDLWKNGKNAIYLLDDENRLVATLIYG